MVVWFKLLPTRTQHNFQDLSQLDSIEFPLYEKFPGMNMAAVWDSSSVEDMPNSTFRRKLLKSTGTAVWTLLSPRPESVR